MSGVEIKILQAEENAMEVMMERALQKVVSATQPQFFVEDEPLTMEQAAKYVGVSRSTLSNWIKEGLLVPHRVGSHPRFLKSELIDLIRRS